MAGDPTVVLLVEDNGVLRRMMARALTGAGHRVIEAADGESALRLAAASELPPRLVVCDLSLPGIDGHELAARLRETHAGLQVLFVTGYPDVTGPEPVLSKPFSPADLTDLVESLIGRDAG